MSPVQRECLVYAATVAEEIGERVRQTEKRRQLGAVIRASQDPQLRIGGPVRMRRDLVERMVLRQGNAREPVLQLQHLLREILGGIREWIQGASSQLIGAGRTADTEVDSSRRNRFQNAKLLGDFECRVMRKHDSGA